MQHDADTIEIGHDVVIGDANDLIAGSNKHGVANLVTRYGLVGEVGVAIDLDGKPGVVAREIEDIGAERDLAAEVETQGAKLAEKLPETALGLGWIVAKGAGAAGHVGGSTRWRAPPTPSPSPQGGGESDRVKPRS
ncbi:MAG: hypothetical protein JWQ65_3086 [Devosia sp.]|nr:hypothetical protein [Devosia sp.]